MGVYDNPNNNGSFSYSNTKVARPTQRDAVYRMQPDRNIQQRARQALQQINPNRQRVSAEAARYVKPPQLDLSKLRTMAGFTPQSTVPLVAPEQANFNRIMERLNQGYQSNVERQQQANAQALAAAANMGAQAGYAPMGAASAQLVSGQRQRSMDALAQLAGEHAKTQAELHRQRWRDTVTDNRDTLRHARRLDEIAATGDGVPDTDAITEGSDVKADGGEYGSVEDVIEAIDAGDTALSFQTSQEGWEELGEKQDMPIYDNNGNHVGTLPRAKLNTMLDQVDKALADMPGGFGNRYLNDYKQGIVANYMWYEYAKYGVWPTVDDVMDHLKESNLLT